MKILYYNQAHRYFLVEDDVNLDEPHDARVLDDRLNKLYPWRPWASYFVRGNWVDFDGDQKILDEMLEEATEVS